MPISATPAVPASAPTTRAVSEVVREMPSAPSSMPGGMVCPTSTWRITMSEGRIRPAIAAMANTCQACSVSLKVSTIRIAASTA